MRVAILSSEVVPFAKTGGLADVAGALPKALREHNVDAVVALPLYDQIDRKFLKGEPLIEAKETLSLMERLPPKIHKIQRELPAWMQKTGNNEAVALMQKMQGQMEAKNWGEVEKTADSILKMMGVKP